MVACVGNVLLGDDGFGVEVARQLAKRSLPSDVVVKEFGIRSLDLTYALNDPYDLVILVDSCQRGGAPGSIYMIEPDLDAMPTLDTGPVRMETQGMNPMDALRLAQSLGSLARNVMVVGCEPEDLGPEEGKPGLSAIVRDAIEDTVAMIEHLISKTLHDVASGAVGR